jgi:pimeloyl-ACP methyl ester carboxylesterase
MPDLAPDVLGRIAAPAILATGGASEPFYGPIAEALAAHIPGAQVVRLAGLHHPSPITDPEPVAALVRDLVVSLATRREGAQ